MRQKILIIKHGALGDFFIAMGAFRAIRDHHREAHITMMTTEPYKQLAHDTGFFDAILVDSRPSVWKVGQLLQLRKTLLEGAFDRVYDLQNSPRTSWYFRLLGPDPRPQWNGIAPGCSHRQTLKNRRKIHAFPRFKDQLGLAGIDYVPWPDLSWVTVSIEDLQVPKDFVLLIPGSSPTRLLKRWPGTSYGQLARLIADRGVTPVLIGGKDDQDSIQEIKTVCPSVLDLSGQTSLYQIIELGRRAKAVVGNDTGPLHMVSLAKCPTVVLWSRASDPAVFSPQGDHVRVILENNLEKLSIDRVYDALLERLENNAKTTDL